MKSSLFPSATIGPVDPTRRRFVLGLAAGGILAGFGAALRPESALAAPNESNATGAQDFELTVDTLPVNYTGKRAWATAVNGSLPAPVLRWREGDRARLRVTNRLPVDTSIHWHGILVPAGMDGVPGMSFPGIKPGETFVYEFEVRQSGTYWYHSHSGFQEQTGLYGPLIIDPREPEPFRYDRDYVVMLSDWTDENPDRILAKLKKQSDYYNYGQRTVGDFFRDVSRQGWRKTMDERRMWGRMRMNPTDIADVTGATYTYLMNGITPAGNWTALFRRGERVRLRFINGAAMSYFDVRIPGLKMTVVQADGQNVQPVTVDEFRIAVAETYDLIVEPQDDQAYTIFAQAMDRSGYVRGTLAPRSGMSAAVPPLDPRPIRTMADMGMAHDMAGMDMNHTAGEGKDGMNGMKAADRDSRANATAQGAKSQMDMSMANMDHSEMAGMETMPGMDHGASSTSAMPGMDHSVMPMDPNQMAGMSDMADMQHGGAKPDWKTRRVHHDPAEYGPGVDMRVDNPTERLDDPGDGLRNNGHRVLTYADLRSLHPYTDGREPNREVELHLTGNMRRYIWSFNGKKLSQAEPLRFKYGERLRIILVNDTMMEHPIHLHGMWSELETGGGRRVRKHTINVKPGERLSYLVTADARGEWAYHCHLAYHMMSGMFRKVIVA